MGEDEVQPAAVVVPPAPAPAPAPRVRAETIAPGDIIWIDMSDAVGREQAKTRPWIVVSTLRYNRAREMVIAVPTTSKIPTKLGNPSRIMVDPGQVNLNAGVAPRWVLDHIKRLALADHVKALAEERILCAPVGSVSSRIVDNIHAGIAYNLGLA